MQTMKRRLGDILVEMGGVDGAQLESALEHQRARGVPLGQVVVDLRFCSAEQVLQALSLQAGVPATNLDEERLDFGLTQLVPRWVAEQHRVVPLRWDGSGDELVVAIAAPADLQSLDMVRGVTRQTRVVPVLAADAAIARAIARLYPERGLILPDLNPSREALELSLFEPSELAELGELLTLC